MTRDSLRTRRRIQKLFRLLESEYGGRTWRRRMPAVDQLILTILSQHTSDRNSGRAFRSLKERFKDWESVANARAASVERAIRSAGLARMKAPRIIRCIRRIRNERGCCDLEFLGKMSPGDAKEYLESFDGVGPKTVACVLLFSFNMPLFPVDTHVLRVTKRLGVMDGDATAGPAHGRLSELVPAELHYPLHLLLIEHGRKTCKAQRPRCEECVLRENCPSSSGAR